MKLKLKNRIYVLIFRISQILLIIFLFNSIIAQEVSDIIQSPESRRFDFWIGEWKVNNRFKQDDNTWKDEGKGLLKVWPVLDSTAIIEFWDGTGRNNKVIKGFSIRYYDQSRKKWIICLNWPQINNGGFFFLSGNFRFNRADISNRRPLKDDQYALTRYIFSDITDSTYMWQGFNSLDSGKSWGSNWIMENFRISDMPEWPAANEKFHPYMNDSFSTAKESKRFHYLEGAWKGEIADSTQGRWTTDPIDVAFWKVQNGVSMLYEFKSGSGLKELGMLTYRDKNDIWLSMRLDNTIDHEIITKYWKPGRNPIEFTEYSQLYEKNTTETDEFNYDSDKLTIERTNSYDDTGEEFSKQIITLKRFNNDD